MICNFSESEEDVFALTLCLCRLVPSRVIAEVCMAVMLSFFQLIVVSS